MAVDSASVQLRLFRQQEIVYVDDDFLGAGLFSEVYRCRLTNSNEVAVKVFDPSHER